MTCRDRKDGGGAQVAAQLSTILYAAAKGATYAHTPFREIAHGPDDLDPSDWVTSWEQFFSIGHHEVQASELSDLKEVELAKPHRKSPRNHTLSIVHHCHKVTNHLPEAWQALRPSIREKYFQNEKPATPLDDNSKLNIAVHVRRGDVTETGTFSDRFTEGSAIQAHVQRVVDLLGKDSCRVHLFSQAGQDLSEFDAFEPIWHLDLDPLTTIHAMVSADILFAAKSCFSWLAGLIGDGRVIQDDFWHPSMPDWINFSALPNHTDEQLNAWLTSTTAPALSS